MNRQNVGAALFVDADGNGIALLPAGDAFDLSVERGENGIIAGHKALVSGVGSKFKAPKLAGSFHVLPLKAGAWPEELDRIFGKNRLQPEAFRPYHEFRQ